MDRRWLLAAIFVTPFLKIVSMPVESYRATRIRWLKETPEGRAHLEMCVELLERKGLL